MSPLSGTTQSTGRKSMGGGEARAEDWTWKKVVFGKALAGVRKIRETRPKCLKLEEGQFVVIKSPSPLEETRRRVCPQRRKERAKHWTLRIAVEKDWVFYYEWLHPGEWEANAHKPKLPDPGFGAGF